MKFPQSLSYRQGIISLLVKAAAVSFDLLVFACRVFDSLHDTIPRNEGVSNVGDQLPQCKHLVI